MWEISTYELTVLKIVIIITFTMMAIMYIKFGIVLWKDEKIPAILEFLIGTIIILIIVSLLTL